MKLHGEQAQVNDSVYDILEGNGKVMVVSVSEITVRFSNMRSYQYNSIGQRVGNVPNRFGPLLYWHNPVFMIPPKKESNWAALRELFNKAHEIFNRF